MAAEQDLLVSQVDTDTGSSPMILLERSLLGEFHLKSKPSISGTVPLSALYGSGFGLFATNCEVHELSLTVARPYPANLRRRRKKGGKPGYDQCFRTGVLHYSFDNNASRLKYKYSNK